MPHSLGIWESVKRIGADFSPFCQAFGIEEGDDFVAERIVKLSCIFESCVGNVLETCFEGYDIYFSIPKARST